MRAHDLTTAAQAFAGPGTDTRHWISYATVDPETPDQKSVTFTTEYGPLVSCTLRPSAIPVVCRVAHEVAGNGEGEWTPFVAGDELLVAIPEGDETAGCVIIGRLNQEIDQWPQQVAGQDATQNTFAFRRLRTPYVFELAGAYLVRNATTGAFMTIETSGAITLANADKAFLRLAPDFIGMQNGTADVLLQIDVSHKQIVMEAAGTKAVLDAQKSSLYTGGTLELGTSGNQAADHAATVEGMVNFVNQVVTLLGPFFTVPLTAPQVLAIMTGALGAVAAGGTIAPFTVALAGALAHPKVPGVDPGIGVAGLLVG